MQKKKATSKKKKPASVSKKIKSNKAKPKAIGKITHYFSNIEVAVIKLSSPLKNGEDIRIVGGENTDFTQPADSIEFDHKKVKTAKKGQSVGLKVDEKVREGYLVYKA
jgi:putative protease